MFLIVGLGNPGNIYKETRHNAGFMAVDFVSNRYNFLWHEKSKFNAEIASGVLNDHKVILCKPLTFMNLSGKAVLPLMAYYKIDLKNLIVIHDDIDLEFGKLKCKLGGSSGGHNGLKSIDNAIGSDYYRIRIGVGEPDRTKQAAADYVLSNISSKELEFLDKKFEIIMQNLNFLFSFELEKFQSKILL